MKRLIVCFIIAFICMNSLFAQKTGPNTATKELEYAFSEMWANTTFSNDYNYFKTDVSDNYLTINTDGSKQTQEEFFLDIDQLKLLEKATFEFFDQKIRINGEFGIINGKSKAYFDGEYVAEFLYTALFLKENGIWKYAGWRKTYSKNSPIPKLSMGKN